jgi:hypothetical protein
MLSYERLRHGSICSCHIHILILTRTNWSCCPYLISFRWKDRSYWSVSIGSLDWNFVLFCWYSCLVCHSIRCGINSALWNLLQWCKPLTITVYRSLPLRRYKLKVMRTRIILLCWSCTIRYVNFSFRTWVLRKHLDNFLHLYVFLITFTIDLAWLFNLF